MGFEIVGQQYKRLVLTHLQEHMGIQYKPLLALYKSISESIAQRRKEMKGRVSLKLVGCETADLGFTVPI